jgi:hypothetical protein
MGGKGGEWGYEVDGYEGDVKDVWEGGWEGKSRGIVS